MTEDLRWIRTHCSRLDHGGCAIQVGVKQGRIVKIKGDPEGYLNRGYVCPKGLMSHERLDHPGRLTHPFRRVGKRGEGRWEQISWTEAIDTIAENLNRVKESCGPRAVAFCQGMPKGLEHFVAIRLANIFGSPNVVGVQDVCHAPREISGIHTCGFYPETDFHYKSELVLLWGSNITSTNEEGDICSLLLDQVREGTGLIVVDPRRTELARRAVHWLQIRPGTDSALALAFLHVVIEEGLYDQDFVHNWTYGFEELKSHVKAYSPEKMAEITWVPSSQIREAARTYAASRPAALRWGNPIEHTTTNFDAARALVCLMAICGNLDIPGGNIHSNMAKTLGLGKFVRADLIPGKRKEMVHAHHHTLPRLMTVPPAFFREAVLEGSPYPIKAAYCQCANPLLSYADSRRTYEALMKLEFLAVSDLFMTPTAALADIVLPAATQFEFNDIGNYGVGHNYILARPKIVDPPGECWPDTKILNELGKSLTPKEYWYDNYEDLLDEVVRPSGINYSQLVAQGHLCAEQNFRKYLDSGFQTPTKKVELMLSNAEKLKVSPLPRFEGLPEDKDTEYGLVLTSSKDPYYLHSSYRWVDRLRKKSPHPKVRIHPTTAQDHRIKEGDEVIIKTRHGQITQMAHLTDHVHPKVVHADYGWWFPEGDSRCQYEWDRANFNILTSCREVGREFGTPNLKGIACSIKRK
ncbi:MAG: molybdopterin-dependent oxidoreductase [Thermodesulfobacteriota bacterium]|nr:molybdopterin-dependent oxidoreductase [Thermodesulfobacteriota bacterium]